MNMTSHSTVVESKCYEKNEGYDIFRYALIVYVGTPIAIFGIISNTILIKCFASRKRFESPTLYLFALAIFDFLICCIYIPFFTVDALAIYYSHPLLYHFWHSYAMLLYGSSRVIQFASTYLVVCATFERFVVVANLKSLNYLSTTRGRFFLVFYTISIVLLLRLPAFFDYEIEHNSQCPVTQSFTFVPLLMSYENYQLYNFYVICFLHILLPFLLLLLLNLLIIVLTKKKVYHRLAPKRRNYTDLPQISLLLHNESVFTNHAHRNELRFATRTMVMITFTYLSCNIFNVIITVMENVFKNNRIMFEEDGSSTKFYTYTADLASITVTINSFARIFVYFFCNPQFRFQLSSYAKRCLNGARKNEEKNLKNCERPVDTVIAASDDDDDDAKSKDSIARNKTRTVECSSTTTTTSTTTTAAAGAAAITSNNNNNEIESIYYDLRDNNAKVNNKKNNDTMRVDTRVGSKYSTLGFCRSDYGFIRPNAASSPAMLSSRSCPVRLQEIATHTVETIKQNNDDDDTVTSSKSTLYV